MKSTDDQTLDCGHPLDPGHTYHTASGPRHDGWQFVVRDGKKICHACDSKRILDCGHHPSPHSHITTGAARMPDGREVCYDCADASERERLKTETRFCAYVSSDGERLTTWSGGDLGRVSLGTRHHWSRERRYLSATDCHGNRWHGTGAAGMWATLRKCKP